MAPQLVRNLSCLTAVGFDRIGRWRESSSSSGGIRADLHKHASTCEAVYAFVCMECTLYIGYSERSLSRRFTGYANPKQGPNPRRPGHDWEICYYIKVLLQDGGEIEIYAMPEDAPFQVSWRNESGELQVYSLPDGAQVRRGEVLVNTASGIEKNLIRNLEPVWNNHGVKR